MNARAKKSLLVLAVMALSVASFALLMIRSRGTWPSTWPKQFDLFRGRATTIEVANGVQEVWYEIPFSNRQKSEWAWPSILSRKSKGAPIILRTGPITNVANDVFRSGVCILCPPGGAVSFADGARRRAQAPWPESARTRSGELPEYVVERDGAWAPCDRAGTRARVDIVLVMDGRSVNTNHLDIPPGTIIIDERSPALGRAVDGGPKHSTSR